MKVLLGPRVGAVALVLSLGRGERPATEAVAAAAPTARAAASSAPTLRKEVPSEARTSEASRTPELREPPKTSSLTPMTRDEAIKHLAQAWEASQEGPASDATLALLCAHWSHETDHGRRMHGYNFGGIKGVAPSGGRVVIWTREELGGRRLVRRTFRAYASPEEGALDYVNLLSERYSAAFRAAREASVERFVTGLGARSYFTDDEPTYLRSVSRLVRDCARDVARVASSR